MLIIWAQDSSVWRWGYLSPYDELGIFWGEPEGHRCLALAVELRVPQRGPWPPRWALALDRAAHAGNGAGVVWVLHSRTLPSASVLNLLQRHWVWCQPARHLASAQQMRMQSFFKQLCTLTKYAGLDEQI